jgi:hypothetical protein
MSGRFKRIRATAEELQASTDNYNRAVAQERQNEELKRLNEELKHKIERMELEEKLNARQAAAARTLPTTTKNRGIGYRTDLAIQAVAAVLYNDRPFPRDTRKLATRAASYAAELGITDPEEPLVPDGRPLRDVAESALKGLKAADKAG